MASFTPEHLIYALFGAYQLTFWPWMILFLKRRGIEPIRSRGWEISVAHGAGTMLIAILVFADSCLLKLIAYLTSVPLTVFPYVLRAYLVWHTSRNQTLMLKRAKEDAASLRTTSEAGSVRMLHRFTSWMLQKKLISSLRFQFSTYLISFIISLIVALITYFFDGHVPSEPLEDPVNFPHHNHCLRSSTTPLLLGEVCPCFVLFLVCLIPLTRVSESLSMRVEFVAIGSSGGLFATLALVDSFYPLPPMICKDFWLMLLCLAITHSTFALPVIRSYQVQRTLQEDLREAPKDASDQEGGGGLKLGAGDGYFQLMLSEPVLEKSFEQFTVESWCVENLVFYRAAKRYRSLPKEQLGNEARKIWKAFFTQKNLEINIDATIKEKVMEDIESENFSPELFATAEKAVLLVLRYSVFPLWKQSSLCLEALRELGVSSPQELRLMSRSPQ